MRPRLSAIVLLLVCSSCIDAARVNRTCTWTEASSQQLDLSRASDREHLRADVQLAGELGVRLADTRYRGRADLNRPVRERCVAALLDTIARRHGVALPLVQAAATSRVWWADVLAVYLPVALLVGLAMDWMTRRICRSFDPEDRPVAIATLAVLVPIMAVLGLGAAQFWGFQVEGWFLRNEHVSFRGSLVPVIRHGWIGYSATLLLCIGVAAWRFARAPLEDVGRSYASERRSRAVASPSS